MTHPESIHAQDRMQCDADTDNETYVSPYRSALQEPTVLLAGIPYDRPDVATAAILGYN